MVKRYILLYNTDGILADVVDTTGKENGEFSTTVIKYIVGEYTMKWVTEDEYKEVTKGTKFE